MSSQSSSEFVELLTDGVDGVYQAVYKDHRYRPHVAAPGERSRKDGAFEIDLPIARLMPALSCSLLSVLLSLAILLMDVAREFRFSFATQLAQPRDSL